MFMEGELNIYKKIFFIGIGGIGISAIARMFLLEGKTVLGSDMSENEVTSELKNLGVNILIGQQISFIPSDVDLIVYTIAVPKYDQKFFQELKSNFKVPIKSYPEMLGIVTKSRYTIAVAGTHGKTTTTAMIAKIFMDAGRHPSVIVGSLLKDTKSNLIVGQSNFFIVEACEFERSFLNIHPKILVITNIDRDHMDYFKDISDIKLAFKEMILQTEDAVVYNGSDGATKEVVKDYEKNYNKIGLIDFSKFVDKIPKLTVPGTHNRFNAAAALGVSDLLNIDEAVSMPSLSEFSGTWRRLDQKGVTESGTIVYDDYAHHPTEIKASLEGLRELYQKNKKKITVLFQPHLYSRTKLLFDDFSKSFKDADKVLLLPIYFARETKDESVSSEKLAAAIVKEGVDALYLQDFEAAKTIIEAIKLGKDDIFVTMGAGEAGKIIPQAFKFV
jgi:UDP-N-acetylmuramate--alanine ligase